MAELVGRRRQIVEMIGREANHRHQARSPKVLRGIERTLAALQAALAELNGEIGGQVRGSPDWRAAEDLPTSVPGVGPGTARTPIAELPEFGSITRRRIAALQALEERLRRCPSHAGGSAGGGSGGPRAGRAPPREAAPEALCARLAGAPCVAPSADFGTPPTESAAEGHWRSPDAAEPGSAVELHFPGWKPTAPEGCGRLPGSRTGPGRSARRNSQKRRNP